MWDSFTEFLNRPSHECLALFEKDYERTGQDGYLNNLGLALFDIGDWKRAKDTYEKIIDQSEYSCEGAFIYRGIADWFMGDHKSAIGYWRQSTETEYTNDPVGPINGRLALWYAGRKLGDDRLVKESLKIIKRFWKVKNYRVFHEWPDSTAIAGFLLDKVPENVFLNEWKWPAGSAEYRRLCRASFWVGMKKYENTKDEAMEHFKTAFSTNKIAILEYEYFLAKWEYSKLKGEVQNNREVHKITK